MNLLDEYWALQITGFRVRHYRLQNETFMLGSTAEVMLVKWAYSMAEGTSDTGKQILN